MPSSSETNKKALIDLKQAYQQAYDASSPSDALMMQLHAMDDVNPSLESAWRVYQAYLSHSAQENQHVLHDFSKSKLMQALKRLEDAGILTGEQAQANFNAVTGHRDPEDVASALIILQEVGLLTGEQAQANRDAVARHLQKKFTHSLFELKNKGLLTGEQAQANFNVIARHEKVDGAALGLIELHRANLLTGEQAQANRDAVARHKKSPYAVALELINLQKVGLLTGEQAQANRDAVARHQNPKGVAEALYKLHIASVLTGEQAQANRDAVARNQDPEGVASTLITLQEAGLLTGEQAQANRNAVAGHREPRDVSGALIALHRAGLLDPNHPEAAQANFNAVAGHQRLDGVAVALRALHGTGLLDPAHPEAGQAFFNQLMQYTPLLFGTADARNIWYRIPPQLITQAHWDAIIALCEVNHENPAAGAAAFIRYVNHDILGIDAAQAGAPIAPMNDGQSTHKASIHLSSSQSAKRLQVRYQSEINTRGLDSIIQEIKTWVHEQPSDVISGREGESEEETKQRETHWKNAAAKRCIDKLTAFDYSFTDPASKVSTLQSIALSWLAIHDDEQRTAELADAEEKYLEGLYDAQRIYNLAERTFIDDMSIDSPACTSGTFNKLIEKLVSVHPDVMLLYIDKTNASGKLGQLIPMVAREHLKKMPSGEVIDKDALWRAIKQEVAERIFFEFGSLYISSELNDAFNTMSLRHDTTFGELATSSDYEAFKALLARNNSQDFKGLIDNGEYVPLDKIIEAHQGLKVPASDAGETKDGYEEKKEDLETSSTTVGEEKQPLSREALREQRLKMFDKKNEAEPPSESKNTKGMG